MIKVKVDSKDNKHINKISILGHALYDKYGKDIVCSSVSSIVDKAWGEKINYIPAPIDNSNPSSDIDIPSFLRRNKGIK